MLKKTLMVLGLAAILCNTSCQSEKKEKHEKATFLVTNPVATDTLVHKDYVCQIHSINHIEVRALEKGYLQNIYIDEGQAVKKGQLLFKIMPNMYQAEVMKAQAEADYAEIEYKNTKALTENKVVAPNELAMEKAKWDKAKAELELAKTHLQFTEIRAPFDGIIDRLRVRVGSLIDEGELITELSDNSKMWVYFNVTESEYLDYMNQANKENLKHVGLKLANGKMFPLQGKVETIEADFDNETGNISFRATFDNPDRLLRYGQTGSVVIPTSIENAMLIPQKATFEVLDKRYVYIITKDNVVKAKEIKIQAELPHLYIVESGLKKSDKILLEGLRKVKDNDKIEIKLIDPKTVISNLELYSE
ncbi:MAG: efflux RND transporter periplasmic adaptor subunit [Flavobacteriaceae bacterium]